MRREKPETITGTLSCCKILPLNGFNLIRVKQSPHMRRTFFFLVKFLEPSKAPKVVYTDNLMEFGKASEVLIWNHRTATRHRSETNGIAERAARRVKEGASAVWFYGMLLLSAKCPRLPGIWENFVTKTIWRTIQRSNNSFWSNG